MTTTPDPPGPGARLLAEQIGSDAPLGCLPPGDHLHRLAHALCQTATELDAAYARAQEVGRELRTLRGRSATRLPVSQEIGSAAAELELMRWSGVRYWTRP